MIPTIMVSISQALCRFAWILFAKSQTGRFQAKIFPWLSLPFFAVAIIYGWFSIVDIDIEIRAFYARVGYLTTALPQAIVLIILFFMKGKRHG